MRRTLLPIAAASICLAFAGLAVLPGAASAQAPGPRAGPPVDRIPQVPDRASTIQDRLGGVQDRLGGVQDRPGGLQDRLDRLQGPAGVVDRLDQIDRASSLPPDRGLPSKLGERAGPPDWLEQRTGGSVRARREAVPERFLVAHDGARAVKGEILAATPDEAVIESATRLGLKLVRRRSLTGLGLELVVFAVPAGRDTLEALAALRAAAPAVRFELNHIFDPTGDAELIASDDPDRGPLPWDDLGPARGARLGLVDLGVDRDHPALVDADIETAAFAGGETVIPSAHGTATASLLVGRMGDFAGSAAGARLYAADVFGEAPTGGAAEHILSALEWLGARDVTIAAIPLAGPPNALLEMALARLADQGVLVVAPVGNEGSTRPVAYPAAFESVVAVTATDRAGRVYFAAQRGPEVMFAAMGAGLPAAARPDGLDRVSGTSFAVPEVTARLLQARRGGGREGAREAIARLRARAVDLGAPGPDPVYGYGWVSYGGTTGTAALRIAWE